MSALTIMPGSLPSPMVSTGHVCHHCYGAGAHTPDPGTPTSPPFSEDFLFIALEYLTKSFSGSSTVAIDNKIEQAMDLVKSHLMFAVREEVEVLKEQIAELIERNNQLEYENGILRAAASPETLAKLAQPRQPPASSSS